MRNKLLIILILLIGLCTLNSCKDKKGQEEVSNMDSNQVCIELTDGRKINLELYPDVAPISVANFLKLVDAKFYDGIVFHRVIDGFMIQAGGYYMSEDGRTIMQKEQQATIKGEFSSNGVENNIEHVAGVLSMARANDPNSGSSQFFICSDDSPHLNGSYAAFGRVMDNASLQVVKDIAAASTVYVDATLANFPYPVITIKTIKRI